MTRSMTGFASSVITLALDDENRAHMSISLKSLNSRFFEATCRLPYQLSNLETALAKQLKKQLCRGHVYLNMHMDNQNAFKGTVNPAHHVIAGYLDAVRSIQEEHMIAGEFKLQDLLRLPSVFSIQDITVDDATKEKILATVDKLTHELIAVQETEGAALEQDILNRIEHMQENIKRIEHASRQLMEEQKEKITAAIKEFEADDSQQNEIHKNAAYALLDKMDIHEEIVRFTTHLSALEKEIKSEKIEKGKRLDFTLQELAREINTITAKCTDATISTIAIDIKVELEKAREQSQNIV